MNKRKLVARAIKDIRLDIVTREEYADEKNWEMYRYMLVCINAKLNFMLNIELITVKQWRMLFKIANNM